MAMNQVEKPHQSTHKPRFIELDILRGFAIIFMVFLHVLWDFDYFGITPLNDDIYALNKIVPTMFFLLLGICLTLSVTGSHTHSQKQSVKHLITRGLWIFSLGMIITIVTLIFMPDRPIFFGVLHCIGISIILCIPFLKYKAYNFAFAAVIILTGLIIGMIHITNPSIIHLAIGFHQADIGRYTIDYFPLFPWFGVCLLGVALGYWLYKDGQRQFSFPDIGEYKPATIVSWMGKHSLLIYLVHQPIIAGVLTFFVAF